MTKDLAGCIHGLKKYLLLSKFIFNKINYNFK